MYRNFHISVGALITRGDKILLQHRTDSDLWEPPSGGLEKGETIFQTLKREVKEETGLIVKPVKLVGVYQNYKMEIMYLMFLAKVLSGKLTKSEEADNFKYFDYQKLPLNLPFWQRERILDYFGNKNKVLVKIQKNIPVKKYSGIRL